jgi:hypothetical protein
VIEDSRICPTTDGSNANHAVLFNDVKVPIKRQALSWGTWTGRSAQWGSSGSLGFSPGVMVAVMTSLKLVDCNSEIMFGGLMTCSHDCSRTSLNVACKSPLRHATNHACLNSLPIGCSGGCSATFSPQAVAGDVVDRGPKMIQLPEDGETVSNLINSEEIDFLWPN